MNLSYMPQKKGKKPQEKERERQRQERRAELTPPLKIINVGLKIENVFFAERAAAQQAYDLTEKEWNKDLQEQAKEYQWDTSQQTNVSIAVMTVEEANEYLDLLVKDTHGELSTGKDYTGVSMGLKGAYEVAKELGGWGAIAKAVDINGVTNIVVENYKPRYLDLGIRWQEATPQMLKIGYALNTVKGNINFLKGNIYVELVFSGAVNAVDYIMHDENLGEVVGQYSADVAKGVVVAGVIAQGATLVLRAGLIFAFSTPPTALLLGFLPSVHSTLVRKYLK